MQPYMKATGPRRSGPQRRPGLTRPRLGIVAYGPVQHHTPLYQLLTKRDNVQLKIPFLSDNGHSLTFDLEFGLSVAWDIDLLSGYEHQFLSTIGSPTGRLSSIRALNRWITHHDAVVVNGYNSPWMLLCRLRGIPYLLRASSHPRGLSPGVGRVLRRVCARGSLRQCWRPRHGAS